MNSTNPNQGHWSAPPLVTHATEPTRVLPVAPAPRRRSNAGTWAAAIATAVLGIAAGAVGATAAAETGPAEPSAPASCTEALDLADELTVQTGQLADLSADAIEAAALWDGETLDALTGDVETLTAEWDTTYGAYETARDDCRAEGGATR